jgi:hypothetical protein
MTMEVSAIEVLTPGVELLLTQQEAAQLLALCAIPGHIGDVVADLTTLGPAGRCAASFLRELRDGLGSLDPALPKLALGEAFGIVGAD